MTINYRKKKSEGNRILCHKDNNKFPVFVRFDASIWWKEAQVSFASALLGTSMSIRYNSIPDHILLSISNGQVGDILYSVLTTAHFLLNLFFVLGDPAVCALISPRGCLVPSVSDGLRGSKWLFVALCSNCGMLPGLHEVWSDTWLDGPLPYLPSNLTPCHYHDWYNENTSWQYQ